MAKKPVELCLELNDSDAIELNKYMENPCDDTPEGKKIMREASELARQKRLEDL